MAQNGTSLRPRNDFVLLEEADYEPYQSYKGYSKVIVPTAFEHGPEDRPIMGSILAKGEACTNERIPVGAIALAGKWTGQRFFRDGKKLVLIKESDVIGVLE